MNEPKARNRVRRFIPFAIIAAALLCIGLPAYSLYQRANRTAEESAHRALLSEVRAQLELHRVTHGSYPRSLSELHITNFQDGATPAMLRQFRYESDGTTYRLHYFGVASRQTIVLQPTAQHAIQ